MPVRGTIVAGGAYDRVRADAVCRGSRSRMNGRSHMKLSLRLATLAHHRGRAHRRPRRAVALERAVRASRPAAQPRARGQAAVRPQPAGADGYNALPLDSPGRAVDGSSRASHDRGRARNQGVRSRQYVAGRQRYRAAETGTPGARDALPRAIRPYRVPVADHGRPLITRGIGAWPRVRPTVSRRSASARRTATRGVRDS